MRVAIFLLVIVLISLHLVESAKKLNLKDVNKLKLKDAKKFQGLKDKKLNIKKPEAGKKLNIKKPEGGKKLNIKKPIKPAAGAKKPKISNEKLKEAAKKLKWKKDPTEEKDMVANIQYFRTCYKENCLKANNESTNPCDHTTMRDIKTLCPPPPAPKERTLEFHKQARAQIEECIKNTELIDQECKSCIITCRGGDGKPSEVRGTV